MLVAVSHSVETITYCAQLAEPAPKFETLPIPVVAEIEKIVNKLNL